jgi:hypothetical protein
MPDARSALVVPIPEVDATFGDVRRAHDPSGRDGMPAHVTVLTPFVPIDAWNDAHAHRLRGALEGIHPFDARIRRAGRFGSTTLFLVPEPERPFLMLARRVAEAFPEYPPYGGAFSQVHPHLTLAHGVPGVVIDEVQARIDASTEIRTRVAALTIDSCRAEGSWKESLRIPLPPA